MPRPVQRCAWSWSRRRIVGASCPLRILPPMPFELPADRATARSDRIYSWLAFLFAAVLVVLVTYLGYVGYEGSRQLAGHPNPSTDCRTPALMGWPYEAINYD